MTQNSPMSLWNRIRVGFAQWRVSFHQRCIDAWNARIRKWRSP